MKILHVTTISDTINSFLVPHIKFLREMGNEVGIACNIVSELDPIIHQIGCKVHFIEFQRDPFNKKNINAYRKIRELAENEGYEVIHVHTPVASLLTRISCRKMKDVKVIYTAHGFHFFRGAPLKNWLLYFTLEKLAARWTDCIITMNDEDYLSAQKFKLKNYGSAYKIHGIGLDLKKFVPQTIEKKMRLRKEYGFDSEDFIVIYVAELSYRKHQDHLIKAMSLLKNKIPNMKLLLVGEGELKENYKNMIKELGLENMIQLLGFRKDVHQLLSLSDIAVSTSRQEGLPVNVMEAMATGLPLIVTDCRGNRDLIDNEVNGLVIGIDDYHACAQAIERLYHSPELRTRFTKVSLKRIKDFSIDRVLLEMLEIYNRQLGYFSLADNYEPIHQLGRD